MACAASLRVAARGGPTVHGAAPSFEDTGAPFRRQHLFRSSSPSPRDGLDDLEAQAAFDCNHSSSQFESYRQLGEFLAGSLARRRDLREFFAALRAPRPRSRPYAVAAE